MEFKENQKDGKTYIYAQEAGVVFVATPGQNAFIPNFSYVCLPVQEMTKVMELVKKVKTSGVTRKTPLGKNAVDGEDDTYKVSIVTIDNGYLVEVAFKEAHPLFGLSFVWTADVDGNTQWSNDNRHYWFAPSGQTRFDLGFVRTSVKIGQSVYNKEAKKFDIEFGEAKQIYLPNRAESQYLLRCSKGMALLEKVATYARERFAPQNKINQIGEIPFGNEAVGQ